MSYQIRVTPGQAMYFEPKIEMVETWNGKIVWVSTDPKEATETFVLSVPSQLRTAIGKKRITAKLNDQRRRLEHHLKSTGKRWEVEKKAEEKAKADAQQLKHNIAKTKRACAEELYTVLRLFIALGEAEQLPTARTIEEARELIERASYKNVATPIAAKANHD